ncbi:hypothetical protein K1T71_008230 [Dendrolimus kikuchii]|uniref:Uncharacterized protein n=1 Tax=Dendrolimus kikuchii TaxID=765133 RepID=A0ACC1CWH7_9NEOP|nr:hypothetical protein K1T71_008230 [Dendrolimus kikuchii]
MAATWSMGPGTLEVPMSLFTKNRRRLADCLQQGQVVILQGGDDVSHYDTDIHYVFRQEAYFTWVCGVREPGCYFALDVSTGKAHLFVPRLPEEYEVWMGKLLCCVDFKKIYAVDEVHYVDELLEVLKSLNPEKLLTLCGPNTDSGLTAKEAVFEGINEFKVDNETLFTIIAELRVIKTPEEIEVMRYVCKISSDAHKQLGKPCYRPFICLTITLQLCGSRHKFSVLSETKICPRAAKPGVMWDEMHLTANKAMLEHLKRGGLMRGNVEDMIAGGVHGVLQPHGLGHLLGLDVHDVGGYLPHCPPRPAGPLARLRTARRLLAGMVLTIEPGCYFIPRLLNSAQNNPEQSRFFDWNMMNRFRGFGGVRIEDDVLITENGVENLTFVPRTVEEIEAHMANGANFK